MNKFLSEVAGVLEVAEVTPDLEFRSIPGWCSLQGFGLLVLMENDWATPLTIERFTELKSVKDLYREAFLSFAAKVLKVDRSRLSGETKYASIPEWDSVNHLKLVMETETRFGNSYPLERIPFLATLDDFLI